MSRPTPRFLVADIQGVVLTDVDRIRLAHPALAGIILFSRNYQSRTQMIALVADIRAANPDLLIMTDQEGGRVQRLRAEGFTAVPPMGRLGWDYPLNPEKTRALVQDVAWLLAAELRATGIDLGLAPVLDIDRGISRVVGDRSFGRDPGGIVALATAYLAGMNEAGMAAVGKHFPGHGGVGVDSHIGLPVDKRDLSEMADDLDVFSALVKAGLPGVMPAHVRFPAVDNEPAGFSRHWLQTVLRDQLGFQGTIFSDCLNMAGASFAGDVQARVEKAIAAGCDLALVCNNPQAVGDLLSAWDSGLLNVGESTAKKEARLQRVDAMRGKGFMTWESIESSSRYQSLMKTLAHFS